MYFLIATSLCFTVFTLIPCCFVRQPKRGQNDQYGDEDMLPSSSEDEAEAQIQTEAQTETEAEDRTCCICEKVLTTPGYNAYPLVALPISNRPAAIDASTST
jgi:hypothetical protein